MTTFEPPDSGLLVEHLLPSLLGTNHSLSQEIQERALFFGDLGTALERLHGRLTVISSPPPAPRADSPYPWLWRYVGHFIVGAQARAVQHAKFWAFHWKVEDQELFDLHVSSTNLTISAFKQQLQAGWQVRLPLNERSSQDRQRSWGGLIPFLEALGASAGNLATERIQRLLSVLARVECPAGATFIISIPGRKHAARQLRQFEPSEIHVMTPTIGQWTDRTLTAWCADIGVRTARIHLKWISEGHPWAACWKLSTTARETLDLHGVQLVCIPIDARFTTDHREGDPRWCHAKLYLLRRRQKWQQLVTSANWSIAAWGAGEIAPHNFELGVLFATEWTDFYEALGEPFDPPRSSPFCVDGTDDDDDLSALAWAEAWWDGHRIGLRARSSDPDTPITALVTFMGDAEAGIPLVNDAANMPWDQAERTPLTARFAQGTDTLEVDVVDVRRPAQFAKTPLPEVDPAVAKALRDAFLLQRYGGPMVDPEAIPGIGPAPRQPGANPPDADYSVKAWLDARAAFTVIDHWRSALQESVGDPVLIERVLLDGKALQALYAEREDPAADLAAEELGWRLAGEA
jgi:hypothetical protein